MSRLLPVLLVALVCHTPLHAQRAQLPQSPRQALIEMFFSDSPLNLLKHLPEATKEALQQNGQGFALAPAGFGTDLKPQGKKIEVLEAGSVLVSSEDPRSGEKFEVAIDRDDLMGDQDEMDLSFHTFKNAQEESLTNFYPKVRLAMALEGGIWKLKEIAFNLHLPLDDPEFLKGLKEVFRQRGGMAMDQPAMSSLSMLNMAENRYKTIHPERGFTCSLTELASVRFGNGPNTAPILDGSLAGGTKDNYKFAITGCGSQPVSTFQITASPSEAGKRAFCIDQSGALKYAADGQAATCLAVGQPLDMSSNNVGMGEAPVVVTSPAQEH
jgi:hypothetical protein